MTIAFCGGLLFFVLIELIKSGKPKPKPATIEKPVEEEPAKEEPGRVLADYLHQDGIANDMMVNDLIEHFITMGLSKQAARKLVEEQHRKMIPGGTLQDLFIRCLRAHKPKKKRPR